MVKHFMVYSPKLIASKWKYAEFGTTPLFFFVVLYVVNSVLRRSYLDAKGVVCPDVMTGRPP